VGRGYGQVIKSSMADVVLRRDMPLALQRLRSYARARGGAVDSDPCNTFDLIMDLSEQHGRRSAFYFIAGHSAGPIDGDYSLDNPWIRCLIQRIHARGHEVGLHPSYHTYRDPARTRGELQRLLRISAEAGVQQESWGGRQHYLRWENPTTWQNWADAGLCYDSTLSFADQIGFRCGVCYEYPVFNLQTRRPLQLRERPLVIMEVTLFGYMRLGWEASLEHIVRLSAICKQFGGDFTLLWHNNSLISKAQQSHYRTACERM
jgi:peptidoglycan/xylan/chitin deacetylase (PgdA/CDA1 family)